MSALFWVLIGAVVVLGGIELVSTNLVFGSLALGALVAAGCEALGLPPLVVGGAGAATAGVSLLALRPAVLARLSKGHELRSGTQALRGASGRVLTGGSRGVVNVSGQEWSAVDVNGSDLVVGGKVWVVEIDGATLVVAEDD
ncbi:MAG: NfeD family protein [Candidatus Nanopelagicales bacterium]